MRGFSWQLAFKIAWREWKASSLKFLFVIFGVAAGVGALTGVRGFSSAFLEMMNKEARTMMAADLTVRVFAEPNAEQLAVLDDYKAMGVEVVHITETLSMISALEGFPLLVSVKAVEPERYPFYGQVRLDPPAALSQALDAASVAISDDLAIRLNVRPGDMVKLGAQQFRVAGVVQSEPDRMTGSLNIGPRVMITRKGLERADLMQVGSRASQRFLFKLPPQGVEVSAMRLRLTRTFPNSQVVDFRQTHPAITRALNRSTTFLSLVSLIALIVGALGVATAIYSHLQQRLDSIAIMKCLGARSGQITRIYTLETALLGLAGGAAGLVIGAAVQKLFPVLMRKFLPFEGSVEWNAAFAAEGLGVGLLVSLLFTLPALLSIRHVRPAEIFRREMAGQRPGWRERLRRQWPAVGAGALILAGIAVIAGWLAESPQMGATFVAGLVGSLLVLAAVAWLLLRGLRLVVAAAPFRMPVSVRHGLANIYRPGNHAGAILVALGVGVMFTLTIYLVQKSLLSEVANAAPPNAPNVFFINITDRERQGLEALLAGYPNLTGKYRIAPLTPVSVAKIDGVAYDQRQTQGPGRGFRGRRTVTWVETMPEDVIVLQGQWWKRGDQRPLVSVSEDANEHLKVKPGTAIELASPTKTFSVTVAAIHRNQAVGFGSPNELYFNQVALAGLPVQWLGTARMPGTEVARLQRVAYEKFPTVTVVNVADVIATAQQVVDQVSLVVRFISAFAILAGAIILASTVAGTRLRRMREAAILKTLGARRGRLVGIFSVEFAILGLVAGIMGSVLATAFSRILLTRLLDAQFRLDWLPNLASIALTVSVAVASGWLASLRLLEQKPLEVLRDE